MPKISTILALVALTGAVACDKDNEDGSSDTGVTMMDASSTSDSGASGGTSGGTGAGSTDAGSTATTGDTGNATGAGDGGKDDLGNCVDANCDPLETQAYTDCLFEQCGRQYEACLGPDFRLGVFAGACGTYMNCVRDCDCADVTCPANCAIDAACQTCMINEINACTLNSTCVKPTCGDVGTTGGNTTGGGTTGGDGMACASLGACCSSLTDATSQSTCTMAAELGVEFTCEAVLTGLQANGFCL